MCATIISTHTFNALYYLSLSIKQHQVFSLTSIKVGEYRARGLRAFFFTESLQIIQGPRSSLVHSVLQHSSQVFNGVWIRGLRWLRQKTVFVLSYPFLYEKKYIFPPNIFLIFRTTVQLQTSKITIAERH